MNQLELFMDTSNGLFLFILLALAIWTVAWKGVALWKSARHSHKKWFIALLIINTAGILDILYVFFFSKKKEREIQSTDSSE